MANWNSTRHNNKEPSSGSQDRILRNHPIGSQPLRYPVPRTTNPIAGFCQHRKIKQMLYALVGSVARAQCRLAPFAEPLISARGRDA